MCPSSRQKWLWYYINVCHRFLWCDKCIHCGVCRPESAGMMVFVHFAATKGCNEHPKGCASGPPGETFFDWYSGCTSTWGMGQKWRVIPLQEVGNVFAGKQPCCILGGDPVDEACKWQVIILWHPREHPWGHLIGQGGCLHKSLPPYTLPLRPEWMRMEPGGSSQLLFWE